MLNHGSDADPFHDGQRQSDATQHPLPHAHRPRHPPGNEPPKSHAKLSIVCAESIQQGNVAPAHLPDNPCITLATPPTPRTLACSEPLLPAGRYSSHSLTAPHGSACTRASCRSLPSLPALSCPRSLTASLPLSPSSSGTLLLSPSLWLDCRPPPFPCTTPQPETSVSSQVFTDGRWGDQESNDSHRLTKMDAQVRESLTKAMLLASSLGTDFLHPVKARFLPFHEVSHTLALPRIGSLLTYW